MAEIKFEGIAKLNKGLKKRMDMSAVKDTVKLNGSEMQKKAQRNAPVGTPESTGIPGYIGGTLRTKHQLGNFRRWNDCHSRADSRVCTLCRAWNPLYGSSTVFEACI